MKKLLLSIFLLLPLFAFAVDWIPIKKTDEEILCYIEKDSIIRNGNEVSMWVKIPLPRKNPYYKKGYRFNLVQYKYRCGMREQGINAAFLVTKKEENISQYVNRNRYNPILPGSNGEVLYKMACDL